MRCADMKRGRKTTVGSTADFRASNILSHHGYRLGKEIGKGSYCKVRIAYGSSSDGGDSGSSPSPSPSVVSKLACKIIDKRHASEDFVTNFLPREIATIRSVRHPNIVSIYAIFEIFDKVYIFMDLCKKGDLLDHIREKGPLPEERCKTYFLQLVSAVEYLHSMEIAHRDLKCENILLKTKYLVKITDFGFSRYCRDPNTAKRVLSNTFCGSAAYAAPEILQGISYNPKMYDVWSLGCILFIMLTATMPFDDSNIANMLKVQLTKQFLFPASCEHSISTQVKRLIYHLLEPDITKRATIKQICRSRWLNGSAETLAPEKSYSIFQTYCQNIFHDNFHPTKIQSL